MASANMAKIVRDRIGNGRRSSIILRQWVIVVCIRIRRILQERCQIDRHVGTANPGEGKECIDFALARCSNQHINKGSFRAIRERL
jgi:hypothetical protein